MNYFWREEIEEEENPNFLQVLNPGRLNLQFDVLLPVVPLTEKNL